MSLTNHAGLRLARTSQLRNGPAQSGAISYNPGFGAVGGLGTRSGDGGAIGYSQIDGVPGGLNRRAGDSGAVNYVPGFGLTGNVGSITRPGSGIGRDALNGVPGGLGATAGSPGAIANTIQSGLAVHGGLNSRGGESGAIHYNTGFGANGGLGDRNGSSGAINYQAGARITTLGATSGNAGAVLRQGSGTLFFGALGALGGQSGAIHRDNVDGQAGGLGFSWGDRGAVTHLNGFGVSGGLGFRRGWNSGNTNRGNSSGTPTGTSPLRAKAVKVGGVRPRKLRRPARVENCCGLPASGVMLVDIEWTHDSRGRVQRRVYHYALVAAGQDWTPPDGSPLISETPPGPFAETDETLSATERVKTYNAPWSGCVEIEFDTPTPYGRVMRRTTQSLAATNGTETDLLQIFPSQAGVGVYPTKARIKS